MRALELGRGKYRFTGLRILIFMTIRFIVHLLTQITLLKGFLEYFTGFQFISKLFLRTVHFTGNPLQPTAVSKMCPRGQIIQWYLHRFSPSAVCSLAACPLTTARPTADWCWPGTHYTRARRAATREMKTKFPTNTVNRTSVVRYFSCPIIISVSRARLMEHTDGRADEAATESGYTGPRGLRCVKTDGRSHGHRVSIITDCQKVKELRSHEPEDYG